MLINCKKDPQVLIIVGISKYTTRMKTILILVVFVSARREKKKSSTEILYGIYKKIQAKNFQGVSCADRIRSQYI